MSYTLGIDLGTTYTSAAVVRDGRAVTIPLGNHGASIPSVVFLQEDGTALVGDAAVRRGSVDPERMAREFKRRIGDTQPVFIGGAPYSPEQLSARLLRSVYDEVASRDGSPPVRMAITHPANWGTYKTDLLHQAVDMANINVPYDLVTEPAAAAVFYATQDAALQPGDVIAIYDLGGGTFDAAVLAVTDAGFDVLGEPSGIERFGGIDLDAAVLRYVTQSLDPSAVNFAPGDAAGTIALQRLREECTTAREMLSADTGSTIPVLLPAVNTSVQLTRDQLEAMARPGLEETINALDRAIRTAGVSAQQLHSIVLVGGTARMPMASQLLHASFGRPIALTSDPTHAVALGAALLASRNQPGAAQPATHTATAAPAAPGVAPTAPSDAPRDMPLVPPMQVAPAEAGVQATTRLADGPWTVRVEVPTPTQPSEPRPVAQVNAPLSAAQQAMPAVPPPLTPRAQASPASAEQTAVTRTPQQAPHASPHGQPPHAPQTSPFGQYPSAPAAASAPPPKRGRGRSVALALLLLLVVAAAGAAVWFFVINTDDTTNEALAVVRSLLA